LIAEPEVTETNIEESDNFLLIACDGLWDVFDNQEIVDLTHKYMETFSFNMEEVPKLLVKDAVSRGSRDDITVIIVLFK